jgi:AcrR family transcriptional regulator
MGLREEKKQRTRQQILETAERLFRDKGYAETPIREIASRLELSPQTLYNYFPSKEGILTAIFAQRMRRMAVAADEMRARYLEAEDAPGTRVERFLHMIRWGLRAMAEDRAFMGVLFLNARAVRGGAVVPAGQLAARDLVAPQEANNLAVDRMFESMQEAGELRADVPPRRMTELYVLIFSDRVACWLASEDEDPMNLEHSVIVDLEILFRGLRAIAGETE